MVKVHITQILHDTLTLDLIDIVAPMIAQLKTNDELLSGFGIPMKERGEILLQSSHLIGRKNLVLDMIEQKYTILKDRPHPIMLKRAWEEFRSSGDKERFLYALKRAEEVMSKQRKNPSI
ncbi:hypothetical protein BEP19_14745 [Ammoniphilus oxalaticus]|uniref:Uncharacterized protein n=1 Tax=Ammoniphilus oxalaticus TaxID=66863 RepID=A0A419SE65_9BACL|nr:hypothetical protein [Ammoniphilus oxalaticus]RKD21477.1 hypothetical protein BEP19_14745 [Ammoniphilus oxalaticus]